MKLSNVSTQHQQEIETFLIKEGINPSGLVDVSDHIKGNRAHYYDRYQAPAISAAIGFLSEGHGGNLFCPEEIAAAMDKFTDHDRGRAIMLSIMYRNSNVSYVAEQFLRGGRQAICSALDNGIVLGNHARSVAESFVSA